MFVLGCSGPTVLQPRPSAIPPPQPPKQAPTFRGVASYDDGSPASGALITITSLASGKEVSVVTAEPNGHFEATVDAGRYALAVAAERGFGWIETTNIPDIEAKLSLTRTCRPLNGTVKGSVPGTRVSAGKKSRDTGDLFVADVKSDGTFGLCLPDGTYGVELRGAMISFPYHVELAATSAPAPALPVEGFLERVVKQPPGDVGPVASASEGVVADIVARDARLIGLGEATHGTAELTTTRSALTFELIRHAGLRLVMIEVDAIAATAIDDYVSGANVDIDKAVASLGFWITDTREFLQFLADLRAYNQTTHQKVRVSGIDLQNTANPVALLLDNAKVLKLGTEDQSMLEEVAEKRAAPVRKFPAARRAALDALLGRLANPRSASDADLRIAVAARSLIVQLGYLEGDAAGLYSRRRDAGMAALASYLVTRMGASRACVWAHAAHVARERDGDSLNMGHYLAADAANRYYPVGFYVFEGSVRAWDAAGEVGVIPHPLPRAPAYSVEGAVMAVTKGPDVAWLPMHGLPDTLTAWFASPRYVREVGASYVSETDSLTLRAVSTEFDALVVIKSGHDSTPTPTGERKVTK
ncbi:MAG: erythromycin esterase family protein [Kofleriaceae bacterium]